MERSGRRGRASILQKLRKSWSPTNLDAARRIASTSRGRPWAFSRASQYRYVRDAQEKRAEKPSATGAQASARTSSGSTRLSMPT